MHGRTARIVASAGLVTALAAVWAAAALAAQVRTIIPPNGPGEGEGVYNVSGGKIKPVNGSITAPSTFKCNASNLIVKATSIKLSKGKLNFTGKAYVDKFRNKTLVGDLTWKGTPTAGTIRFVSARTPQPPTAPGGHFTYVKKKCDTGTLRYKLRT